MRDDIDTDQIIPKQFLKRVERTGFGEFLFYDWAKEPDWDLPVNQVLVAGQELRLRLQPRARPVGAGGLRVPRDHRAVVRRHLPARTARRSGCCRCSSPPRRSQAIAEAGECQVDLAAQEVRWPGGTAHFDIDQSIKHRLLNGLDDIGAHAAAGRRDRRVRARPRAPAKPDHDRSSCDPRTWDAATYDRVSAPQVAWSEAILDRLELRGDEVVLDAGCGSGRVTELLLAAPAGGPGHRARRRRRHGRARPASASPATRASRRPPEPHRARPRRSPSTPSSPARRSTGCSTTTSCSPVSARATKPGGRISAQCGGEGNIAHVKAIADRLYPRESRAPGSYAGPEETRERLERSGLHRRADVAAAVAGHAAGAAHLPARTSSSARTCSACPRPSATPFAQSRARRARRAAGPGLRPPEHRRDGRLA